MKRYYGTIQQYVDKYISNAASSIKERMLLDEKDKYVDPSKATKKGKKNKSFGARLPIYKGEIMSKKEKKSKKSKGGRGSGLMKELNCSEELQAVIKRETVSRGKCMRYLWDYIKKHKLQSKKDGRVIEPDKKLAAMTQKKPFRMTKLGGFVSEHLSD